METDRQERANFVKGLRDFANFIEANDGIVCRAQQNFYIYTDDKEVFKTAVRAIGSKGKKEMLGDWASYVVNFGPIQYRLLIERAAVCQRKVLGTKNVEERAIAAHVEEIVEWECEPWLGNPDGSPSTAQSDE
jgi:hypothetical protein